MKPHATVFLLALTTAGAATALPWPGACEDPCVISGHGAGFLPPVAVIADGSSVIWESLDSLHVNQEGTGSLDASDPCFFVDYSPVSPSDPVTFGITGGGVTATVGLVTETCGNAQEVDRGTFTLQYWCVLHPTMRGALVVTQA